MLPEKGKVRKKPDHKVYSQEDKDRDDERAKLVMMDYCSQRNIPCWVHDNTPKTKYGIDLMTPLGGIECEISRKWGDKPFPFPELHIAGRKKRHIGGGNVFAMVNDRENRIALVYTTDHHYDAKVNTDITEGEWMMIYPLHVVKFRTLIDGIWEWKKG